MFAFQNLKVLPEAVVESGVLSMLSAFQQAQNTRDNKRSGDRVKGA